MSTSRSVLGLRLRGPMQSWGFESQYSHRNTGLFPTKSALVGMCCAAMGICRGSADEAEVLQKFSDTEFLVVTSSHDKKPVRRLTDYHTVQGTVTAEGKTKETHLTHRQYLCDAGFIALFSGEKEFLTLVGESLIDPVWGMWLGRKACVPSSPVFAGFFDSEGKALDVLLQELPQGDLLYRQDVAVFGEGGDSVMDVPISFKSESRKFVARRIQEGIGTALAIHLFRDEKAGLAQAARIAGVSASEMMDILAAHQVPLVKYSADELADELGQFST